MKKVLILPSLLLIVVLIIIKTEPLELLKQYRDWRRFSDLTHLKKGLDDYIKYNAGGLINLGSVGVVYKSENFLPHAHGNGWLPVDFIGSGTSLKRLPLDPVNESGFVYTYSTSVKLEYKLTAKFESKKYQDLHSKDNGTNPERFEIGTNLGLAP